jgi:hypothetical protein
MEDHIKDSFANRQARLRLSASLSKSGNVRPYAPSTTHQYINGSSGEYKESDEKEALSMPSRGTGGARTQPISHTNKRTSSDSKRPLPVLPVRGAAAATTNGNTGSVNVSVPFSSSTSSGGRLYTNSTSAKGATPVSSTTLPVIAKQPRR